jgi:phosphatidylglycerophosphate synthase
MAVQTRRPLKTRQSQWARQLAAGLAALGVRPNTVSVASVLFAALAGVFLFLSPGENVARILPLLAAATCIQLRLLCNMLDGLIAVESIMGSAVGELFNDVPDRIADAVILVGAGLAVRQMPGGVTLGWLAAFLACLTAYVRVLGGSLGIPQSFAGPMAKQHRMFVVTLGCLTASVESILNRPPRTLYGALAVVAIGSAITAARRTAAIASALRSR